METIYEKSEWSINMHDWTLESVSFNPIKKSVSIKVKWYTDDYLFHIEDLKRFEGTQLNEWGPSTSILEDLILKTDTCEILKIFMQSGDELIFEGQKIHFNKIDYINMP